MGWRVLFDPEFELEFKGFPDEVKIEILARAELLKLRGPHLGRPYADTLNGSRHANMKELRFTAVNGAWRVAFAFGPNRNAILLAAGNKSRMNEKRFYRTLIATADKRFERVLS